MVDDPEDDQNAKLRELADRIEEEFAEQRPRDAFKEVSVIIDDEEVGRETLIVHLDGSAAPSLAEEVEEFLSDLGARTERERHSETDIRVLAVTD